MPSFTLRGSIPLENPRAHLCITIGSAVCKQTHKMGRSPNPHPLSFVAKERDGLLRPSFSIFKVYASLSSRAFASRLCRPLTTLSLISSRFYVCVQKNRVIDCNIVFICQLVFILEIIQQIGILQKSSSRIIF